MVQFLSIIFFLGFLQFLSGFSKVSVFCVTLYKSSSFSGKMRLALWTQKLPGYRYHIAGVTESLNWHTWFDNKVRELIAVKVLHTSLLNTTVVTFKVLPLGSYAPMPAPSPPFKTILELVLWNGLQSWRFVTPDVIVIKMPSFQYFLYLGEQKKVIGT